MTGSFTTIEKKGGEAPKGASRPLSAPFLRLGGGRGSDPSGDRSPSGAPLRRLPRRANARTQPRPRFTRNTMRRRYLRLESRLSEAPRAPVIMPAGTMPGPPGSGVTSPARRNRTRSINWLSPVDVPDVSETARLGLHWDHLLIVGEPGELASIYCKCDVVTRLAGGGGCYRSSCT